MRRVSIALLGACFAMYGAAAIAVDFPNGAYWGFNGGISEEDNSCNDLPVAPGLDEQPGCNNTDFGWQLFAGYQFMKWIGVEGGYTDLGGSKFRAVQDSFTTDLDGWTLSAVATAPYLEKIGLYITGGAFFWDKEVSVARTGGGGMTVSDTGTDVFWGVALRYPFTEAVGIDLEARKFLDVGSSEIGESDSSLYSAGLLFRF